MSDNFTKAIAMLNDAILKRKRKVDVPRSRLVELFLVYLTKQGFIDSFFNLNANMCSVYFKFVNNECLLKRVVRISKPSHRIYVSVFDLKLKKRWKRLRHGVLSTSNGLICSHDAYLHLNLGGELLVDIWL